jgi:hypothetical protein
MIKESVSGTSTNGKESVSGTSTNGKESVTLKLNGKQQQVFSWGPKNVKNARNKAIESGKQTYEVKTDPTIYEPNYYNKQKNRDNAIKLSNKLREERLIQEEAEKKLEKDIENKKATERRMRMMMPRKKGGSLKKIKKGIKTKKRYKK